MSSGKRGDEKTNVAKGATLYSKHGRTRRDKTKKGKSTIADINLERTVVTNRARDPEHEDLLIRYLGNHGIEVKSYKKRYILRRLRVRMGRLKLNTYQAYLKHIKSHPKELAEIQESLSINVTRFFRNRDTFEKVQNDILPVLVAQSKTVKIWSAGCAVGAEPYTIAMIASNVTSRGSSISVLATDVKEELLRTARFATYSGPYLDEMEDHEIRKYFLETPNGDYKVKPHIKSMVNFQKHDLMKDEYPRNLDLIFCRNVLIYVDRQAQNLILNKFFKALNPGGILVLGRTETLFGDWRKSVDIISTKHRIYQKKVSGEFQPINLGTPLQNITGSSLRSKASRLEKSKVGKTKTRIPKIKAQTQSDRLTELRNFRQTFEERKKIWEERLERSKKERKLRHNMREGSRRSSSRRKSSLTEKRESLTSRLSETTTRLKESRAKLSNMRGASTKERKESNRLADYRKLLKKTDKPTRIAEVRKDLKKKQVD